MCLLSDQRTSGPVEANGETGTGAKIVLKLNNARDGGKDVENIVGRKKTIVKGELEKRIQLAMCDLRNFDKIPLDSE